MYYIGLKNYIKNVTFTYVLFSTKRDFKAFTKISINKKFYIILVKYSVCNTI